MADYQRSILEMNLAADTWRSKDEKRLALQALREAVNGEKIPTRLRYEAAEDTFELNLIQWRSMRRDGESFRRLSKALSRVVPLLEDMATTTIDKRGTCAGKNTPTAQIQWIGSIWTALQSTNLYSSSCRKCSSDSRCETPMIG
jgi:hypothetical protein